MNIHVKIFHHEWKGLGPTRNVVVNNASGKYIVWVDGICFFHDPLEEASKIYGKNPKVGIAKARYGLSCNGNIVTLLEDIAYVVDEFKAKDNSEIAWNWWINLSHESYSTSRWI